MTVLECPWCHRKDDYLYEAKDEFGRCSIRHRDYENIECVCPFCGGGFDASPNLKLVEVSIEELYVDEETGEADYDWDYCDPYILRIDYIRQKGLDKLRQLHSQPNLFALPSGSQSTSKLFDPASKQTLFKLFGRRKG